MSRDETERLGNVAKHVCVCSCKKLCYFNTIHVKSTLPKRNIIFKFLIIMKQRNS